MPRIPPPIIHSAPFDSSSSSCNRSEILHSILFMRPLHIFFQLHTSWIYYSIYFYIIFLILYIFLCSSSTPSSPHVIITSHPDTTAPSTPWSAAARYSAVNYSTGVQNRFYSRRTPYGPGTEHFKFPEPRGALSHGVTMTRVPFSSEKSVASSNTGTVVDTITSNKSNDSDKTLSGSSDRSDSVGTAYRLDSQVR